MSSGVLPISRLAIADGTLPFCVKSLAQDGFCARKDQGLRTAVMTMWPSECRLSLPDTEMELPRRIGSYHHVAMAHGSFGALSACHRY
jgi:hypothetical protein